MINKRKLLHLLYREDIMQKMHEATLDGLIGTMVDEYRQFNPLKPIPTSYEPPIFRAVINMFMGNFVHHFAKDIIEIIAEIIERNPELLERSE